MIKIERKFSANISINFEDNWLYRYPSPFRVVHYNGTEFTDWKFQIILDTYVTEQNPTNVKNLGAN